MNINTCIPNFNLRDSQLVLPFYSFVGTVVPLSPSVLEKKTGKKHNSFIARGIRTLFNTTLGGQNIRMIEQLNLSSSVPTNYEADCLC